LYVDNVDNHSLGVLMSCLNYLGRHSNIIGNICVCVEFSYISRCALCITVEIAGIHAHIIACGVADEAKMLKSKPVPS
jgi:hypothetical protein